MSNDLISRSAIYNKIAELEELARSRVLDTPTNSPCYQRYIAQLHERTALKHLIANEPAAYDVDKVAEKIRKAKDEYGMVDYINDKPVIAKEQAIGIIKKESIE